MEQSCYFVQFISTNSFWIRCGVGEEQESGTAVERKRGVEALMSFREWKGILLMKALMYHGVIEKQG